MRGLCYFFLSILTKGESIFSAFVFACVCKVLVGVKATVCVQEGGCICGLDISELHRNLAQLKSLMSFTVSSSTLKVTGFYGDNVTLSCRYDTQTQSVNFLSFCWGQDKVPISKCSKTILSFEEGAVRYRKSARYKLLGRLADGDVSLTIVNAQWTDAGMYGCRVEIPGWFNDHKVNVHLVMEQGNAHENHTGWTILSCVKCPLCKKVDFWVSFLSRHILMRLGWHENKPTIPKRQYLSWLKVIIPAPTEHPVTEDLTLGSQGERSNILC